MKVENKDLVLKFFTIFSRFEYALKASGAIKVLRDDAAEADWTIVEKAIQELSPGKIELLRNKADILLTDPPKIQVLNNGILGWRTAGSTGGYAQNIIASIKRVRNNLFHGGKYSSRGNSLSTRSYHLLHCSIEVLNELIEIPQLKSVSHYFHGYDIEEG